MKFTSVAFLSCCLLAMAGHSVLAQTALLTDGDMQRIKASFKKIQAVRLPKLVTPEVVEIPLPDANAPFVYNINDGIFEPVQIFSQAATDNAVISRLSQSGQPEYLVSGSYWDFQLPAGGGDGYSEIIISPKQATDLSSIVLRVAANSRLPHELELVGVYQSEERIIIAREILEGLTISFPSTKVDFLKLRLYYRQPWRLSSIELPDKQIQTSFTARFLARPGNLYTFYWDQGWAIPVPVGELPSLSGKAVAGSLGDLLTNDLYRTVDGDGDGVIDKAIDGRPVDNCPNVANTDQLDANNNGIGDACEDFDRDGVLNYQDNCVDKPNANQLDTDHDGIGDICDTQESRLTEKYKWLPWLGIAIAGAVLFTLFIVAAKHEMSQKQKTKKKKNK